MQASSRTRKVKFSIVNLHLLHASLDADQQRGLSHLREYAVGSMLGHFKERAVIMSQYRPLKEHKGQAAAWTVAGRYH